MLYGFYPFDGENTEQIMKAIVRKPLSHPNDWYSFGLEAVIRDEEDDFGTGKEVICMCDPDTVTSS